MRTEPEIRADILAANPDTEMSLEDGSRVRVGPGHAFYDAAFEGWVSYEIWKESAREEGRRREALAAAVESLWEAQPALAAAFAPVIEAARAQMAAGRPDRAREIVEATTVPERARTMRAEFLRLLS